MLEHPLWRDESSESQDRASEALERCVGVWVCGCGCVGVWVGWVGGWVCAGGWVSGWVCVGGWVSGCVMHLVCVSTIRHISPHASATLLVHGNILVHVHA